MHVLVFCVLSMHEMNTHSNTAYNNILAPLQHICIVYTRAQHENVHPSARRLFDSCESALRARVHVWFAVLLGMEFDGIFSWI